MSVEEKEIVALPVRREPTRTDRFGFHVGRSASPLPMARGGGAKRAVDVAGAGAGIVLLLPLLAAVALAVRLDSPGPVFYRQKRYGRNRRPFMIWKFRSMVHEPADRVFRQARPDDERVTRVGRFLRRTNLDELPQLLNVLNGTMSLVGPRPHPVELDEELETRLPLYRARFRVRPGITGWAQVNGFRGETITEESMRGRIEHDLFYVDHQSVWFDLRILFLTLFSGKAFRNAY